MVSNEIATVIGIGGAEMITTEDAIWFRDDFPLWGALSMQMNPEHKAVIEELFTKRYIVTDGITHYIYCEGVASWMQLYTEIASRKLLRITNINAPVNFSGPLQEAYALAKRIAYPIAKMHPSLCLGSYRFLFVSEWAGDGVLVVHYRPHYPVIASPNRDPMYDRIYCFVRSPVILTMPAACPYKIKVDLDDVVLNKILLPLRDDQKIDFMWRMGKALTDPTTNPSVIVFYGKVGHEGKTELAKSITRLFGDAVEWVSTDLFGSKSEWPDADLVMRLCQKRILICDECRIEDGFSYNNVKRWTSEAPITMNGRIGYLAQTAIVTSNKIPFYEKGAVNNSIGRRLVIYHMNKNLEKFEALDRSEISNLVILRFVSLCLSYSRAFPIPPVSLPIALYTVFRKNVNRITAGLVYDVGSSKMECIAGTSVMGVRCGVSVKQLCSVFAAISPDLIYVPEHGSRHILSIRTLKATVTPHGDDVINKRRTADVPTINLETMLERIRVLR